MNVQNIKSTVIRSLSSFIPWEKREWIKFASDEWPDNAGLEGASIAKNQYLLVEWSGVSHVEHFSSDL
jgi:hypothetical protein